jgi:hypothetical protein
MRKLSPANAQRIIDAACYSWREKLAVLWAKNIVLEKDIEISEDFYKEMRKACTPPQNELFDEIFGKDVQYKEGDWVVFLNKSGVFESHGRRTDRAYKIQSADKHGLRVFKEDNKTTDGNGYAVNEHVRPATPEEIQQAQCPYYDGQLVAVTDNKIAWELVYASGKLNQHGPTFYAKGTKGNGGVYIWKYHKPLPEGFNLD